MRFPGSLRRSLGMAFVLALSVGLGAGLAEAQEKSKTNLKVLVFSVNGASPTIKQMVDSAAADAKKRGWTVETYDGNGDQVATNNQVNTYITRGFNALINIASDNNQMGGVIANAKKAGIPFVSTFSGMAPGITVDIGSNNVMDGVIAASEMVGRINGTGHVVKLNWNVLPALQERDRGFWAVVKEYPNIKVTEVELKVPGQVEDAYNQLTNLLTANKDIVAVWAGWNEPGIASVRAIEQAKREKDVFVVDMDGSPAEFDLICRGSPLVLNVAYDVSGMGVAAAKAVADAVDGKTFPARQIYKKPCRVTKESVPAEGQSPDFKACLLFSGDSTD
jgi:ribose transport system substrate-binding protein